MFPLLPLLQIRVNRYVCKHFTQNICLYNNKIKKNKIKIVFLYICASSFCGYRDVPNIV